MKRGHDFERKEVERKYRRKIFYRFYMAFAIAASCLLVWNLRSMLLPILVGALLAYLFRPLKDRFHSSWLPHEMKVLALFAAIGFGLFVAFNNIRQQMPNERQKLELQVRLKYKLNESFKNVLGRGEGSSPNPISYLIAREAGPVMDQLNHLLDLSPEQQELFRKYRRGYKGEPPIEDRFYQYFEANSKTSTYAVVPRDPAHAANPAQVVHPPAEIHAPKKGSSLKEELTIWMLAPIIFLFLGFDNGQMRRYFIGLVPNRYFELSLTVMDMLDDAIGRYLRGTLAECALVGLTLTLGFFLLGIPFGIAVAIGVISGLVNAIPFLGTIIGLIIGLGYALIAEGVSPLIPGLNSSDLALYVLLLVILAHILDNVVFQPFVLGHAVNLHPLVVVIAILGGSLLMGLWGMLFAIPAVVVLKTAVETLLRELKAYRII